MNEFFQFREPLHNLRSEMSTFMNRKVSWPELGNKLGPRYMGASARCYKTL